MSKRKPRKEVRGSVESDYEYSIPERQTILDFLVSTGQPCGIRAIAAALMEEDHSESRKALRRRLRAMERDGQIIRNRKEGYAPINKLDLLKGRVMAHPDGYGFLIPDEGGEDLYLSSRQMRKALNGDRALARISGIDSRGRREGQIVEVLEHVNNKVVGRFFKDGQIGYLIPDNKRIHQDVIIPPGQQEAAKNGNIVVVEITKQPDKHTQPIGRVISVLGEKMAPDLAIDMAIHNYGFTL